MQATHRGTVAVRGGRGLWPAARLARLLPLAHLLLDTGHPWLPDREAHK